MPYACLSESDEIDQAGYDVLMKQIGREAVDAPAPAGFIAHVAGPRSGGGWRVVDVWESREHADAFYGSETFRTGLGPALEAIRVTEWPLHRLEVDRTLRHVE